MQRPYLSVIIPAWNEARRLPLALIDIDRHLAAQDFTSEIIVALSPSADNTAEILSRLQAILKNLKVIPLIENQGKGFAVRQGMAAARGTFRLMMDADNSTSIVELAKMLPYLTATGDGRADLVVGSRFSENSSLAATLPFGRRIREAIGRLCVRLFITRAVGDTGCGFKCFSAHAAETIFPLAHMNGWALETEVVALAEKNKLRIKEVPVFWSYDIESHPHPFFSNLREYISLWFSLRGSRSQRPAQRS